MNIPTPIADRSTSVLKLDATVFLKFTMENKLYIKMVKRQEWKITEGPRSDCNAGFYSDVGPLLADSRFNYFSIPYSL